MKWKTDNDICIGRGCTNPGTGSAFVTDVDDGSKHCEFRLCSLECRSNFKKVITASVKEMHGTDLRYACKLCYRPETGLANVL